VGDAPGEAVGAGVEAGELRLEGEADAGHPVEHERLDLGPGGGAGTVDVLVVRGVEHDHVVAGLAQREHVVRGVVHVAVGLHLGLGAEEADVAVGDPLVVEPGHRVGHGDGMAPVDAQAVGDDADPHAGVGEPPQGLGGAGKRGHVAEHAVLEHREAVEPVELLGPLDAPLGEVPRSRVAQRVGVDAPVLGDDRAEGGRVVTADAVEVDAEDEVPAHRAVLTSRRRGSRGPRR
jgi:hypothetical protein